MKKLIFQIFLKSYIKKKEDYSNIINQIKLKKKN